MDPWFVFTNRLGTLRAAMRRAKGEACRRLSAGQPVRQAWAQFRCGGCTWWRLGL